MHQYYTSAVLVLPDKVFTEQRWCGRRNFTLCVINYFLW